MKNKIKDKKCKVCADKYSPFTTTQIVCSQPCALEHVRKKTMKDRKFKEAKQKREFKENDKSFQTKKTQSIFNKYVRLRDSCDPCISCARYHSGQYHAGHYLTVGAHPGLRFEPDNCHKQCAPCNNHRSGDIINYRIRLASKISIERLAWIEGPHEPKRYTLDDLKEIQKHFKTLTKEME